MTNYYIVILLLVLSCPQITSVQVEVEVPWQEKGLWPESPRTRAISQVIDDYAVGLIDLLEETKIQFDRTYMTEETNEIRERREQQAAEAQEYLQQK